MNTFQPSEQGWEGSFALITPDQTVLSQHPEGSSQKQCGSSSFHSSGAKTFLKETASQATSEACVMQGRTSPGCGQGRALWGSVDQGAARVLGGREPWVSLRERRSRQDSQEKPWLGGWRLLMRVGGEGEGPHGCGPGGSGRSGLRPSGCRAGVCGDCRGQRGLGPGVGGTQRRAKFKAMELTRGHRETEVATRAPGWGWRGRWEGHPAWRWGAGVDTALKSIMWATASH